MFGQVVAAPRKWLVLGGMLELGDFEHEAHRALGEFLGTMSWRGLVALGPLGGLIADGAEAAGLAATRIFRCGTAQEAARDLAAHMQPGDAALLKASRGMALEQVLAALKTMKGFD